GMGTQTGRGPALKSPRRPPAAREGDGSTQTLSDSQYAAIGSRGDRVETPRFGFPAVSGMLAARSPAIASGHVTPLW
ncbi:MAG: hypothetical protein ACK5MO_09830, partial [Planctomyces sp.]